MKSFFGFGFLIVLIIGGLLFYGFVQVREKPEMRKPLRISLIQGNIPQEIKWDREARGKIIEIYSKLTELSYLDAPDLVIWPEAAFPGYFSRDFETGDLLELVRKYQVPTVIGSPHLEDPETVFNSAYYVGADGEIQARYDKLCLVPFGEYVPWKFLLGWLEPLAFSLGVGDFSVGTEYTVFRMNNGVPFSVLICFEDVFPNLARNFVNQGARMLALITNDAWFGPTTEPYQHLSASIFRAVENGVPVVRAANTGISAFISEKGIVFDRVQSKEGKDIFVTGRRTATVYKGSADTLYRKGGYLFPYLVLFLFGAMLVLRRKMIL